jgi:hypothetical protein
VQYATNTLTEDAVEIEYRNDGIDSEEETVHIFQSHLFEIQLSKMNGVSLRRLICITVRIMVSLFKGTLSTSNQCEWSSN